MKLKIPNMACPKGSLKGTPSDNRFAYGDCAKTITQAVIDLDPKATVKADITTKEVIVHTQASESSVKEAMPSASFAIAAAGYPPA